MNESEHTRNCWCGSSSFIPFGPQYGKCTACGTLVSRDGLPDEALQVTQDEADFYGKQYWLDHQESDLGHPTIAARARTDLSERNLHWLRTLLKYSTPPATLLELGCGPAGFVALTHFAGFQSEGIEMSPWVVEFGKRTFGVPLRVGPIESLDIPVGSLDVIALMDVLEHLPHPQETMRHCLDLLKEGGFLLIQTPQFRETMQFEALAESASPFLPQLKADEHLYLFSEESVREFFRRLGCEHLQFEPAIFSHYDMFFVVSRTPLTIVPSDRMQAALASTPTGRLVQAMLDLQDIQSSELGKAKEQIQRAADQHVEHLKHQLAASEADRAARLKVIESQGAQLSSLAAAQAQVSELAARLEVSEADRAARLSVIQSQGEQIGRLDAARLQIDHLTQQLLACEADRAARLDVIHQQGDQLGKLNRQLDALRRPPSPPGEPGAKR